MKSRLRVVTALVGLSLSATVACAKDDKYNEPINAYKSEMSREPVDVRNPNYFQVLGESQANRSILTSRSGDLNLLVDDQARSPGEGGDSIINIASPRIDGNVRGNVNVIVERNAIKGNVTSIRR